MISLFYNPIYSGTKKNIPKVVAYEPEVDVTLNEDLKKILANQCENTPVNNEVCFWIDSVLASFTQIIASTVIGGEVRVTTGNDKADEVINKFNEHINVLGDHIEDFMRVCIFDNIMHAKSIWRITDGVVDPVPELASRIDLQRLPLTTLDEKRDVISGWRKYVQNMTTNYAFRAYKDFLQLNFSGNYLTTQAGYLSIPVDPRVIIEVSFFERPPMAALNELVVIKRWVLWFLKKYAEKMWSPVRIGKVGDSKNNWMPNNEKQMDDEIERLSHEMTKLKNFTSIALPGYDSVETVELKNNGQIFLDTIKMLDEQLMFGIMGSMSMRESGTSTKAATLFDENLVHVLEMMRHELVSHLRLFYVMNLLTDFPDVKRDDIQFHFPPLRTATIDSICKSTETLAKIGVFKDMNEMRKAAGVAFPFLSEQELTAEEMGKQEDLFVLLNAPSQPDETTPGVLHGSKDKPKGEPKPSLAKKSTRKSK